MSNKETITRIYREAVASYGGEGVDRPEAIESALATLMVEVRAGRLEVDVERALRAELQKADESDGRAADAIFIEELHNAGWYDKVSQAFTVFLPVRSVGVMGDGRTYDWVVSLRCVETTDFMTAKWSHLPYELLGKVSNRIINEVKGINRVCYDVSGKPPATIEWE